MRAIYPYAVTMAMAAGAILWSGVAHADIDLTNLTWTIEYQIDNVPSEPDDLRGIAVDPARRALYVGYNNNDQNHGNTFSVKKLSLCEGSDPSVVATLTGMRGKSIATDDRGRVYHTGNNGESVYVYDAELELQLEITAPLKTEGIAVRREEGTLALYVTERNAPHTLTRFELTEVDGVVTAATPAGLDGDGVVPITYVKTDGTTALASDLRGVAFDVNGRIWLADAAGHRIFRMEPDGTGLTSVFLNSTTPYYFGMSGKQVFLTQYFNRTVAVFDADTMAQTDSIVVPWAALGLDENGAGDPRSYPPADPTQGSYGVVTGIAMLPDGSGFYLTHERGVSVDGAHREALIGVNIVRPDYDVCTCPSGYVGDGLTCTDVDECAAEVGPCAPDATCKNTVGAYECTCLEGFEGDGVTCTDVDECANGRAGCDEHASCANWPGGFTCTCAEGYTGDGHRCCDLSAPTLNSYGLAAAGSFNVFLCGGDYQGLNDVGGAVAVNGDLIMSGFSLGRVAAAAAGAVVINAAVVAGEVKASHGTIYGNAVSGVVSTYPEDVTFAAGGAPLVGEPIDFDAACETLRGDSRALAAAAPAGATSDVPMWGTVQLVGTGASVNVFQIDGAELAPPMALSIQVPAGAKALVNVSGTTVKMGRGEMWPVDFPSEDVLLNLYEATLVTISAFPLRASMLAPLAEIRFDNGNFDGQLIGREMRGDAEGHHHPFSGLSVMTVDCR